MSGKLTQFDYLLNAMEAARQQDNPAEHGYGNKRKALFVYVRGLEAAQAQPARVLTDAEIIAIGHRKATKYTHRSAPEFCSYGFVDYTLIDFARAILAAQGADK